MIIETPRLKLRAYTSGDGAMIFAMAQKNRAHLQRYESGNSILKPANPEEAEKLIGEFCTAWKEWRYFLMGAFDRVSGEFVAQVYVGVVSKDLPEFEVGYFVDCDHEGQGFVSEAVRATLGWLFDRMGAHRVRLRCNDTNRRSARVAERNGFQLEGHLRESHLNPDGSYSGDLCFGMLRDEFQALKTAQEDPG